MEVTGFTAAESSWIGRNRGTAQWRSFNASGPIGSQIERFPTIQQLFQVSDLKQPITWTG
jgi:hypothetical protein